MNGVNLANNSAKNGRRELDYYPTPPEATIALMEFLHDIGLPECASTIWEPACGDGAMSKVLESYGYNVISTDIRHTGYGKGGIDYLEDVHYPCSAVITNPPFNQSSDFIVKAIGQAPLVAMLLKSQYWHASKRTSLFKKYPPAYVLALNWRPDFLNKERGGAPTMECLWTVWIQGNTDTRYRILQKPIGATAP